jgi:DDE superfamily endonuclease
VIQKIQIPIKKPKKSKNNPDPQLTDEEKEHNKTVSKTRVRIEHAIGSMKIFTIVH